MENDRFYFQAGLRKAAAPSLDWLEDPEVFAVNRLPAHSDHAFYLTEEDCLARRNTLKQSLNGAWRFHWSASPGQRPAHFMEPEYDLADFDTINVPGHMELAGYGQIQYTNTAYPWDGHAFLRPPHIDWSDAPVGNYVCEFDLNEALCGRRVCLSFQGAEQAIYVWLNGVFVGYGEDSFTPSDFDVTTMVKETGNRLCVEVYKRCSASWIEDQDFFRFSGLFREVFLYAKPESHIENLSVTADWNESPHKRRLSFRTEISGSTWETLDWELFDADGESVLRGQLPKDEAGQTQVAAEDICIASARPWDVGAPYLYRLMLTLHSGQGEVLEVVPCRVGFRHFEIRDKMMLLNGRRLVVNGVNRHEWSPYTGRAIGEEEMRCDIAVMKKNGINAVRTSHYPNQSLWYELCDEAGICVLDETNLESHGTCMKLGITETSWNIPRSDMRWAGCCMDRARSMYERDKNHPSILWWSAGNESHVGDVIARMCEYFHTVDSTRLVHYEAVFYDRTYDDITDVESRMYPHPEKVREYLENAPQKPMLLCEYMHDMGNSMGGLETYRELMEEFPLFQGGFLWDFIDQALYSRGPDGTPSAQLLYGGDFCDRPTDYAFCANGLLFADRTEKPAMDEVRYWYLPEAERAAFDLKNAAARQRAEKRAAEELAHFSPQMADGGDVLYRVPTGPQGSSGAPENAPTAEKEESVCAQYLDVVHTDFNLGVKGEGFEYIFSFDKGGPTSLRVQGAEQLYRAPRPTFWRAPTENDQGCGFHTASAQWLGADLYSAAKECAVEEFGDGFAETLVPLNFKERRPARKDIREVEIRYTYLTATVPQTAVTVSYRVNAAGKIKVSLDYKGNAALPDLPAFGMTFTTPAPLPAYTWEGLLGETYPDRQRGAAFGAYTAVPDIPAYLAPQECGNHTGTVRMEAGGLVFLMEKAPFDFSVLPCTQQQLADALHREELPESRRSILRILGAVRGVGGIDSWGSDVECPYHVSGGQDIHFAFHIIPRTSPTPAGV